MDGFLTRKFFNIHIKFSWYGIILEKQCKLQKIFPK